MPSDIVGGVTVPCERVRGDATEQHDCSKYNLSAINVIAFVLFKFLFYLEAQTFSFISLMKTESYVFIRSIWKMILNKVYQFS